ncbi:MAG: NAD-dependent epimerase/dehydratase family protein [Firmicutes bacterium]|nr:NAD-dependent epimerase/dehydratase family protein [Bacillota bacterium]
MIIITGTTGHIGNNLLRIMISKGYDIKILLRQSGKAISDIKVKTAYGDIFDPVFLAKEIALGDTLIHLAGFIDLSNRFLDESVQINETGTKIIIDFCQTHQIRFIYTSSVDAIYREKSTLKIKEPCDFFPEKLHSNYAKTKAKATQYLYNKMTKEDMNALILYPSAVIGIHDYKPSAAGIEIQKSLKRKIFFYVKGGYNFIDVIDCCNAIISGLDKNLSGSYILSGYNHLIKKFYEEINFFAQKKAIYFCIPGFLAKAFSRFVPGFSRMMIDAVLDNYQYDNTLMKKDLLEELTPFPATVEKTIRWFQNRTT